MWVNRATPVAQHLHALGLFSFYRVEMSMDYFFQIRKSTNPTKHKKKNPNSSIKFLDLESNHQVGVTLFTNDGSDFFPLFSGFHF